MRFWDCKYILRGDAKYARNTHLIYKNHSTKTIVSKLYVFLIVFNSLLFRYVFVCMDFVCSPTMWVLCGLVDENSSGSMTKATKPQTTVRSFLANRQKNPLLLITKNPFTQQLYIKYDFGAETHLSLSPPATPNPEAVIYF